MENSAIAIVSRLTTNKIFNKRYGLHASCTLCDKTFNDDGIICYDCYCGFCTDCYVKGIHGKAPFCMEKLENMKKNCRDCVEKRYDNRTFECVCCDTICSSMHTYECDQHGRICYFCIGFALRSQGDRTVYACKQCSEKANMK